MSITSKIRHFSGRLLLFVFSMQLLTSCYTANELRKSLDRSMYRNTDNLRLEFGPPNYVLENGDLGTIWVYSQTYVQSNPGYIGNYGYYYLYNPPSSYEYEASKRFWVDKSGIVVKWETRGHDLEKVDGTKTLLAYLGLFGGMYLIMAAILYMP